MAIDRNAIEDTTDDTPTIRPGTNKWEVLEWLLSNPESGFTRKEIAEATNIPENSIGPVLSRLKEEDLVIHKMGHWMAGSDDRIENLADAILSLRASSNQVEPEDFSGWKERAVDE